MKSFFCFWVLSKFGSFLILNTFLKSNIVQRQTHHYATSKYFFTPVNLYLTVISLTTVSSKHRKTNGPWSHSKTECTVVLPQRKNRTLYFLKNNFSYNVYCTASFLNNNAKLGLFNIHYCFYSLQVNKNKIIVKTW